MKIGFYSTLLAAGIVYTDKDAKVVTGRKYYT